MSEGEGLLRQEDLDELFRGVGSSATGETSGATPQTFDDSSTPAAGDPVNQSSPSSGTTSAGTKISLNEISDPDRPLRQAEIDRLLEQAGLAQPKQTRSSPHVEASERTSPQDAITPQDLEYLLEQAEQALRSVEDPAQLPQIPELRPFQFEQFGLSSATTEAATLDLVGEVELEVRIELGQARLYLEDVLKLRKGSVVTLDKLAGDPVDIYVNGRLIARGEVLVLNDNFCVRVAELVVPK